ncbi:hypothetical protein D3C80_1293290 [compost metagenome]
MFQLHRHFQQVVVLLVQFFQHFVTGFAHHGGAWVVVLVHAVAKAHQAEGVVLVLGALDKLRDVLNGFDLFQHFQRGFVGAAVCWPPQGGDTGRDTGKRVSA